MVNIKKGLLTIMDNHETNVEAARAQNLVNGNYQCDAAEEAVSTDSDEYLSGGPFR